MSLPSPRALMRMSLIAGALLVGARAEAEQARQAAPLPPLADAERLQEPLTPPSSSELGRDPGLAGSSSAHPQPTPAEIEARRAARQPRTPPPASVRPVYDLFGNRLQ
jgi:hypothetical protein